MNSKKLLLIDAGNTRVKWALTTNADEKPLRLAGHLPTAKISLAKVRKLAHQYPEHCCVLASVVPNLTPLFRQAFKKRFLSVDAKLLKLGLRFDYPKPAELGADRIAVAVAIQAEKIFPAIIVACGTATAFTVLDAKGRLCGGVIAPGLQTQLAALVGSTAQLPAPNLQMPRSALAKSTSEAIRAGVMLGFQGGIREIITQLTEAIPAKDNPQLILTGGNAEHIAMTLELPPFKLRPLLVLEGLRIIGSRIPGET